MKADVVVLKSTTVLVMSIGFSIHKQPLLLVPRDLHKLMTYFTQHKLMRFFTKQMPCLSDPTFKYASAYQHRFPTITDSIIG